jgi:hypothetical protein
MRFNLLCDNCNWEFAGFALPWTIPTKPTKKTKHKRTRSSNGKENTESNFSQTSAEGNVPEIVGNKN